MPRRRPAARRRAAACALAAAALAAAAAAFHPAPAAALPPGDVVVRSEGRAPVNGRADAAYQQALDEAFRRAVLAELPRLLPDRQSPADLEVWQKTILARAPDFVAGWRVLAHEEDAGFLRLELEVGLWRQKLAAAARAAGRGGSGPGATPPVRVLVVAHVFTVPGRGAAEDFDVGRAAAAGLEAELARRGAVVVAAAGGAPAPAAAPPGPEESRAPGAAAEARRLGADAAVVVELAAPGPGRLLLGAQLVSSRSGSTIAAARAEALLPEGGDPAAGLASAARAVAGSLAPRLGGALSTPP